MMILILKNAPPRLRGQLTRWLLEPRPGVFVGHVSALVRDKLWEKCCRENLTGGVLQIWSTNNEQRFDMRAHGQTDRSIIEIEGIKLVHIP